MFAAALDHVVAKLAAAGVNASVDPAGLNIPGVWVAPGSASWPTLDATTAQVEVQLYLVVPSTGGLAQVHNLDALIASVRAAGVRFDQGQAVSVRLPNHHPAGLPGFHTTTTLDWRP